MLHATAPASGYATTVTLITGLAWPLVAGVVIIVFRSELAELLRVITKRLSSAQSFKVGPVEIGGIVEAAEERVKANISEAPPSEIPIQQVEASRELEEQLGAMDLPQSEVVSFLKTRLKQLSVEYDRLRIEGEPGEDRTRRMNEIAGLMRTLALPAMPLLPELTISPSPGERLASIAILQVRSLSRYIPWLRSRFSEESQPFLLYNTALVLRRMSRLPDFARNGELREAIAFGLSQVRAYKGGTPDQNTLEVLEEAEIFAN